MSRIPWRELCSAECGQRRMPGSNLCRKCARRAALAIGPGGPMDRPPKPSPSVSVAYNAEERHQDEELRELGRCLSCNGIGSDHELTCPYVQFVDQAEEYDPGDIAESL